MYHSSKNYLSSNRVTNITKEIDKDKNAFIWNSNNQKQNQYCSSMPKSIERWARVPNVKYQMKTLI